MALFNSKKKTKVAPDPSLKTEGNLPVANSNIKAGIRHGVILRPRITEKATNKQQDNVYVFEIYPGATKSMVSRSFFNIYKIHPLKVNISRIPPKSVFVRGKFGKKREIRKAYVFLKKGDSIELV